MSRYEPSVKAPAEAGNEEAAQIAHMYSIEFKAPPRRSDLKKTSQFGIVVPKLGRMPFVNG